MTEISIYTGDHPGLFSQLAGAVAMCGANIVDAKIFTTTDGMALDMFSIQDAEGGRSTTSGASSGCARRSSACSAARSCRARVIDARHVRRREEAFRVEPRVLIDNSASDTYTVIEVNGRDRPGLAARSDAGVVRRSACRSTRRRSRPTASARSTCST